MKFLLDENFPKSAVTVLEKRGHEVLDVRGPRMKVLKIWLSLSGRSKSALCFLQRIVISSIRFRICTRPTAGLS